MTDPTTPEVLEQLNSACRYLFPDRPPHQAFDMAKALIERLERRIIVLEASTAAVDSERLSDAQLVAGVAALRNIRTKFHGNATDGAIVYAVYFAVLKAATLPQS